MSRKYIIEIEEILCSQCAHLVYDDEMEEYVCDADGSYTENS